jgi:hypothetical protein
MAGGITWKDIARRAGEAKAADPELDVLILCKAFAPALSEVRKSPFNGEWCIYEPRYLVSGHDPFRLWDRAPHQYRTNGRFTASVDAILALIGENAPGLSWAVAQGTTEEGDGPFVSGLYDFDQERRRLRGGSYEAFGETPALALTAAFALAMDAIEREGEKT